MVLPVVLVKIGEQVLHQLLPNLCHTAARKLRNHGFPFKHPFRLLSFSSSSSSQPQQQEQEQHNPSALSPHVISKNDHEHNLIVFDFDGLLFNPSFFPYFMLVAFEAGSLMRSFLLFLSCSFLWLLGYHQKIKVMTFITFCGLRVKDTEIVSRAVLPKFYLENINLEAYEALVSSLSAGSKVVVLFTSVPIVLLEGFLKEYLGVDSVVGSELQVFGNGNGRYYSGFVVKHEAIEHLFGEKSDAGIGSSSCPYAYHLFPSLCKKGCVLNKEEMMKKKKNPRKLPRDKYPTPLVFHDGRLAFFPTPLAMLSMFIWLPLGISLAIFRIFIGIFLPYKLAIFLGSCTGMRMTLKRHDGPPPRSNPRLQPHNKNKGVLYVCNHRTLLDPIFLSTALDKPLTAVTYSLSKVSEFIAPIKTVRLKRDRRVDAETIQKLLEEGDLVVCPEGTTCREPYLLRFNSLFAELTEEIVPVGMNTSVSMFYGTTASGFKWLDPVMFLMNPKPSYSVEVLGKLPEELTCSGGRSGFEVANYVQKQLGGVLGFDCTWLTRRDKYLMLAGNDGRYET